jgi:hypothetical protein
VSLLSFYRLATDLREEYRPELVTVMESESLRTVGQNIIENQNNCIVKYVPDMGYFYLKLYCSQL